MRDALNVIGAIAAVIAVLALLALGTVAFGFIPLILFLGATGFGVWRLIATAGPQGPTMTGLRQALGAYNVIHVYFLYCMGREAFDALHLYDEAFANWDKFVVCTLALAVYATVGYFGRWRDNTLVSGQPWSPIALVQGMFLAAFFFMPYVNINPENLGWAANSWQMWFINLNPLGWWSASNPDLMGLVMFMHLAVWCAYVLTAKFFDRAIRMVGLYWAMRASFGAVVLWWGLKASSMTHKLLEEHGTLASVASVLWIVFTIAVIIVFVGAKIARDMSNSDNDFWYTAVSAPGVFKTFGSGGDITHFIANFSGVPEARVGLPIFPGLLWVITRDYEAIWNWMLKDLDGRGDPRWFCSDNLWVGPGFAFPGIPFYTKVMEITEAVWERFKSNPIIEKLGSRKFGTFQRIGNWKEERGPLNTGNVDLIVKLSFGWRLINPFTQWSNNSWLDTIKDAIDSLAAGLVREMRFNLVGESGVIRDLANFRPAVPARGNQPEVMERLQNDAIRDLDNAFVHDVAADSGGLADRRQLEDVDISEEAIRQAMTDDVSIRMMVERLRASKVPQADIDKAVTKMLIAQAMGRSGLDIALITGAGGLLN